MPDPENSLIAQLPRKDRLALQTAGEAVPLHLSEVLCEAGVVTRHVYFPLSGFISLVARIDRHGLEVGMIGREGMLGLQLALGSFKTPQRALVHGPGVAWRLEASAFRRELEASPALRLCLQHYLFARMTQLSSAAGCLRFHQIGPRLARWLLMSQDRAGLDSFHVTHEFLAYMLGVRRVGITVAAGLLQAQGLIRYHRGELQVLDRTGLEAAACSCYASDCAAYRESLATLRRS